MRYKTCLCFLLLLILLVTSSGCQAVEQSMPTPTSTPVPVQASETPLPTATATLPPPYCPAAASYGQIWEHWPTLFHIESTSPTFTWFYNIRGVVPSSLEAWDSICTPETYTIHFTSGPEYDNEILIEVDSASVVRDMGKLTMEWTMNTNLEPLKDYRWFVEGHAKGFNIDDYWLPYLHKDSWWPPESTYFESVFRTGPECATGNISIPPLLSPLDGALIQTLNPTLIWDVEYCMPLVFWVEISTLPTFDDPQNDNYTNEPGDYTKTRQSDFPRMKVEYILRDCTTYYWRVTGGLGECRPITEGCREWGVPSEVRSFTVNLGQCATPTPTFIPWAPTSTATLVPAKPTDKPTEVPPPVDCSSYKAEGECWDHKECEWIAGATTGYCQAVK